MLFDQVTRVRRSAQLGTTYLPEPLLTALRQVVLLTIAIAGAEARQTAGSLANTVGNGNQTQVLHPRWTRYNL